MTALNNNRVHVLVYPKDTTVTKDTVPMKQFRLGGCNDIKRLVENLGEVRTLVYFTTTSPEVEPWKTLWERKPVSYEAAYEHLK